MSSWFGVISVAAALTLTVAFSAYYKMTRKYCRSKKDLTGKVAIVTGCNTGIGLETARGLAQRHAKVIMACRDVRKGQEALLDIVNTTGNSQIELQLLDLSQFDSVRKFSQDFLDSGERLDILINNAGVLRFDPPRMINGINLVMATNYFGPFLLTNLLLPALKKSAPSRVVVVSSDLHHLGNIDLDNLEGRDLNSRWYTAYSITKLANILFAFELSRRLQGTGVTSNALHPGAIRTQMSKTIGPIMEFFHVLMSFLTPFFLTAVQGAQTSIFLAVDESVEGMTGKFFGYCSPKKPSKKALDKEMAWKLWEKSLKITGLTD